MRMTTTTSSGWARLGLDDLGQRRFPPADLDLRAHRLDGGRIVGTAEYGGPGHESIGARLGDLGRIFHLDPAVDLKPYVAAARLDSRPRLGEFAEHPRE